MIGRIVSTKMLKSATVLVETKKVHPLYKKRFVRTKKYIVHDSIGVKMGDVVALQKSKPISKRKHWLISKILGADTTSIETAQLKEEAAAVIAEVIPEEKTEIQDQETKLKKQPRIRKNKSETEMVKGTTEGVNLKKEESKT